MCNRVCGTIHGRGLIQEAPGPLPKLQRTGTLEMSRERLWSFFQLKDRTVRLRPYAACSSVSAAAVSVGAFTRRKPTATSSPSSEISQRPSIQWNLSDCPREASAVFLESLQVDLVARTQRSTQLKIDQHIANMPHSGRARRYKRTSY